jgi:hypothetical protein
MSKEKKPKVVPNSDVPLVDYAETLADIKRQIEEVITQKVEVDKIFSA